MEAFEEYLEIKQVGKISLCQILGCFLNTSRQSHKAASCLYLLPRAAFPLSFSHFPLLLLQNEWDQDQDQENSVKPLKTFQVFRNTAFTWVHTHTYNRLDLPKSLYMLCHHTTKTVEVVIGIERWPREADILVANRKLKRSGVVREEGSEWVAFGLDVKNISIHLCVNIMIIILAEHVLFPKLILIPSCAGIEPVFVQNIKRNKAISLRFAVLYPR